MGCGCGGGAWCAVLSLSAFCETPIAANTPPPHVAPRGQASVGPPPEARPIHVYIDSVHLASASARTHHIHKVASTAEISHPGHEQPVSRRVLTRKHRPTLTYQIRYRSGHPSAHLYAFRRAYHLSPPPMAKSSLTPPRGRSRCAREASDRAVANALHLDRSSCGAKKRRKPFATFSS
jgi:hypothetical protein